MLKLLFINKLQMLTRGIIVFLLCFIITPMVFAVTINKSPNDHRVYEYITLENGLEVLLISDPETSNSGVALGVNVGQDNNPKGRKGLAHLLEHMVALGSTRGNGKDAKTFVDIHNGAWNAFTTDKNTDYLFTIKNDFFQEALDLFIKNFIDTKINAKFVDKEKHAVDAEAKLSLNKDGEKFFYMVRELTNPAHPLHNYGVGELKDLSDTKDSKIVDDLQQLYNDYYSSDNMHAILLSNKSISELKQLAQEKLGLLKRSPVKKFFTAELAFRQQDLAKDVRMQTNSELNELNLFFVIPYQQHNKEELAHLYIAQILSDTRSGGLESLLKKNGLIFDFAAAVVELDDKQRGINLQFSLTELGESNIDEITALTFKYIAAVKKDGIREDVFNALKSSNQLEYRFIAKNNEFLYLMYLMQNFVKYKPENIISDDYIQQNDKFNFNEINRILKYMTYKNMLRLYFDKRVIGDKIEQNTKAKYSKSNITKAVYNSFFATLENNYKFTFNVLKDFAPKNFDLAGKDNTKYDVIPSVIKEDDKMKVWHLYDAYEKAPIIMSEYMFEIPLKYTNSNTTALLSIYSSIFNAAIAENTMELSLSKIDVAAGIHRNILNVSLSSYSDNYHKAMMFSLDTLFNLKVNKEAFVQAVGKIKKTLTEESNSGDADHIVNAKVMPFFDVGAINKEELLHAINNVTLQGLREFQKEIFNHAYLTLVLHGNIDKNNANEIASLIENTYGKHFAININKAAVKHKIVKLPRGVSYVVPTENNFIDQSIVKIFQAEHADVDTVLECALLTNIMDPYFFHELRTHDQLGYTTHVNNMNVGGVSSITFSVISPHKTVLFLDQRIDAFIKEFKTKLLLMPQDKFLEYRNALKKSLLEWFVTIDEKHDYILTEIIFDTQCFERHQQMLNAVDNISKENILTLFDEMLFNKTTASSVSFVASKKDKLDESCYEWFRSGAGVFDLNKFKQSAEYFD